MRILTIADQIAELEATRRDLQGMLPKVQGAGHARLLRRIASIDDSLAKLKEPPASGAHCGALNTERAP